MTMEAVDKRWYIGYTWWIVLNAIGLLGIWILGLFLPIVYEGFEAWGIAPTTIFLAVATLLYRVTLYRNHSDKYGLNFATFVISLLQISNAINLVNLTGWEHSIYIVIIFTMLFFSGIVGIYPILGAALLLSLYALIKFPFLYSTPDIRAISILLIGYVLCFVSYFVWRGQYIDQESQKVSRLSSMVKNKQQQSEILIGSIADGVIVTDTQGKINLINPGASKMTGWPTEEALNVDVRSVLKLAQEDGKPLESNEDIFAQVFAQKNNFSRTMSVISRDNKKTIASLVISPVKKSDDDELLGAVAVIRDVGAERQIEQQRADFISTASHEMRTPVAAIEGYLALAMNPNVSKIDNKAKEYLEKAHSSTQHLGQLFQDLLTSAKAEDGRLTSHPTVVEMGAFIESLADDLRFSAEKKGLGVEFVINSATQGDDVIDTSKELKQIRPLYYSFLDPDRIREVVTNIFDNAVKYTPEGKVSLGLTGNNEVVQIRVSDTGPGIPADDIPHLFQKFYRVDNTATRTVGGTGLGLFICKKIVELYSGNIWAESKVGTGSTFYINLPRLSSAKAEQVKQDQEKNQLISDKA